MDQFMELLKGSTIIQGVATLVVLVADAYMAVMQIPIPEVMALATGAVIGFWFGSKNAYNTAKASRV